MDYVTYAQVERIEQPWLLEHLVLRQGLTLVVGARELKKGWGCGDLLARLTRGDEMPGSRPAAYPGGGLVVTITGEDDANFAFGARLDQLGAIGARVIDFTYPLVKHGRPFRLPADVPSLRSLILQVQEDKGLPVLCVYIDPLSWASSKALGSAELRPAIIDPLEALVRDKALRWSDGFGPGVLMVGHLTADGKIAGRQQLQDALRAILWVRRSEADPESVREIWVEKASNAPHPDGAPVLAYSVDGEWPHMRVNWRPESFCERSAPITLKAVRSVPELAPARGTASYAVTSAPRPVPAISAAVREPWVLSEPWPLEAVTGRRAFANLTADNERVG